MYNDLDNSKREIRLLRLLPGTAIDEIKCELIVSSLDKSDSFEALSYVWGDARDKSQITLHGEKSDITKTLKSALRHLRRTDKPRILWVDAICIRQDDVSERNSQVRLMRYIFSSASRVVVWLGEAFTADEEVIKAINTISENPNTHWTALDLDFAPLDLRYFLTRSWWSRTWTAQELILAKQATWQCGNFFLSGSWIDSLVRSFSKHHDRPCCIHLWEEWSKKHHPHILVEATMVHLLDDLRGLNELIRTTENQSFHQLASVFRNREATDPRDKVYGLLGLSRDISDSIVDYARSTQWVYEAATREIINESKNLDILGHVVSEQILGSDVRYHWSKTPDLPSWVPDWQFSSPDCLAINNYNLRNMHLYDACDGVDYEPYDSDSPGVLEVSGIFCDTVKAATKVLASRRIEDLARTITKCKDLVKDSTDLNRPYVSGGTVVAAFWRTLCLDMNATGSRAASALAEPGDAQEQASHNTFWHREFIQMYDLWNSKGRRKDSQGTPMLTEYNTHMGRTMIGRKFVVSEKGYIGLAPADTEINDRICVLAGGKMAFIARPAGQDTSQADGSGQEDFTYRMLGTAYIHGLMDGEAMKMANEGVLKLENIRLI